MLVLDLALFYAQLGFGVDVNVAQLNSLAGAAAIVFALGLRKIPWWPALLFAALAAAAAIFVRAPLLVILVDRLSWPPAVAILLPALLAAVVFTLGLARSLHVRREPGSMRLVTGLLVYALLLKLLYLGLPEIIHEEGYYWNYAQHLALGYLDHPPMVAWIIWAFTSVLGQTELAVRLGAFGLWFVSAFYLYRLTRRIFSPATAVDAVLLLAILPYPFGVSFVMLPDSVLMACWLGAVYYFHCALIDERPGAFIGVGVFVGLGLLSKYTIVLLAFAAIVFVLADRRARRWLLQPLAWLSVLIALAIFSPVIVWNAQNDWVSFMFQGPARATGDFDFDLFELVGAAFLLLTPVGLLAAIVIFCWKAFPRHMGVVGEFPVRSYRLLVTLAAFPVAVFVVASLFRNTKLIWTGPAWLALLPMMGRLMTPGLTGLMPVYGRAPWMTTAITMVLLYGAGLYYLVIGFPGVPYFVDPLGGGWREASVRIENVVQEIEDRTGQRPMVATTDTDQVNSWLAFYRGQGTNSGAFDTASSHYFGDDGGMYTYWFPPEQAPSVLVVVSRDRDDLTKNWIEKQFTDGDDIQEIIVRRDGQVLRRVYYRVVRGFTYQPRDEPAPLAPR